MISKIYIVDDDEAVRQSLSALLEVCDYQVEDFSSGESFLAAYADDGQSCLLLDVHMPGLSGLDVVQHLRQVDGCPLPAILMTGRDDRELRSQVFAAGATSYLEKPVNIDQLLAIIASLPGGDGGPPPACT
jgi:FixJ family two-component response regulator